MELTPTLTFHVHTLHLFNCAPLLRYPLQPWLLTAVPNPRNRAEERFNVAHKRGRSVVERTFGTLKARFRCLDRSGGCLLYSPERCVNIIVSCLVLHNICVERNTPVPNREDGEEEEEEEEDEDEREYEAIAQGQDGRAAVIARQLLIDQLFR